MENQKNKQLLTSARVSSTPKFGQGPGIALIILLVIVGLSAAALVTLSFFIRNEVVRGDKVKDDAARILGKFDEIAELNKKRPIAQALKGELEKSLPLAIDVPTRIFPLARALAGQYGVPLEISLGAELPGAIPGGGGYAFSARAEGTATALGNFLSAVEGLEMTIQIQQWSFSANGENYRLVFSGTIFTRAE